MPATSRRRGAHLHLAYGAALRPSRLDAPPTRAPVPLQWRSALVNVQAIAGVSRDFRGRQIVSVKGHPQKLEVSRSYAGLFKGM